MKKSIRKVVSVLGFLALGFTANAQKIGHIKFDSLVQLMPEAKTAQDIAKNYMASLEKEVMAMEEEFQKKYNEYMEAVQSNTMSDLVRKTKEADLQDKQKRIEDFKVSAQQDYQRKFQELSKPLYDKAKKAIEMVAKENGYRYILDTSTDYVLYHEASDDCLMLVKKKLESMPLIDLTGGSKPKPTPTPAPAKPAPAKKQ